jgi:hypothetical protein
MTAPTVLYSVGENLPGYLPMADEPTLTDDPDRARALVDDLAATWCDYLSECAEDEYNYPPDAAPSDVLSAFREDLAETFSDDNGYGYILPGPTDTHRGLSVWVEVLTPFSDGWADALAWWEGWTQ